MAGGAAQARRRALRAAARTVAAKRAPAFTAEQELDALFAAASGDTSIPLGPRTAKWDGAAAAQAVAKWASSDGSGDKDTVDWSKYASAFFYKDTSDGPAENFGDYKLGFAEPVNEKLQANWGGITAVAGVLQGARGGADIPDADVTAIKNRVEGYYDDAAKQYSDPDIEVPWKGDEPSGTHGIVGESWENGPPNFALGVKKPRSQARAVRTAEYAKTLTTPNTLRGQGTEKNGKRMPMPLESASQRSMQKSIGEQISNETGDSRSSTIKSSVPRKEVSARSAQVDTTGMEDSTLTIVTKLGASEVFSAPNATLDSASSKTTQTSYEERRTTWSSRLAYAEVGASDLYEERFAFWVKQFASPPGDPADTMPCADGDCGHPAGMHNDIAAGDNMGACAVPGCDCDGFEMDMEEGDDLAAAAVDGLLARIAEYVTDTDKVREAVAQFTLTFASTDDTDPNSGIPVIDAHKPNSKIPKRHPSPRLPDITKVPTGVDKAAAQMQWQAVLAPEATMTADNRAFAPDSISWRDLPLTLMGLVETSAEGGHDGAQVAGRIDQIWRAGSLIMASGVFDTGEFGQMIARMVGDGTLSGISVDLAVHQYEMGPKSDWFDADGQWAPKPDDDTDAPSLMDILFGDQGDDMIYVVTDATIGAATACPFQAFAEATIKPASSLTASTQIEAMWTVTGQSGYRVTPVHKAPGLVASAVATEIPVRPPAEWFADPGLDGPTALTVTDDGRIYGHAAEWNVPHIAFPDNQVYAPHSKTGYAYYLLGEVACEDGERFPVGNITLGTGHAASGLGQAQAAAHYDHTGTVVADVTCGEDEYGIWVAGALRSTVTEETIRALRAAKLSGDWRNVDGNLEMVAALAVNVPGFPIPRTRASVVASGEEPQVMSLTAAGIVCGAECQAAMAEIAELADSIEA